MNQKNIILFIAGIIFGFGLAAGGMSKPETVLSFLALEDFGLLVLMFSAAGVNFFAINVVPRFLEKPLLGGEWKPRERKFFPPGPVFSAGLLSCLTIINRKALR